MTQVPGSSYDVIVVGAGHAGCEAAFASARRGHPTALITLNINAIALMPCNPSIGGPGKGHLVRELYALGGTMPEVTDRTYVQIRMLNESKGPAVQALRAQSDKAEYSSMMRQRVEAEPLIDLMQAEVTDVFVEDGVCRGVITSTGMVYRAKAVILTTGPYLRSDIIIGKNRFPGGPHNQMPAFPLGETLGRMGLEMGRLQTATPPRLKRDTIDFTGLKELPGQTDIPTFTGKKAKADQMSCFWTTTTRKTIDVIHRCLENSPLKLGNITQKGPKHCPSIDRKVIRFPEIVEHGIFLEPEGARSDEIYLQGLTTAMPADAQEQIIATVPGLEKARIVRYGYAIEYDFVYPHQLRRTLELKKLPGLYLAGQPNATTGYEEAACQGFVAGVNASLKIRGEDPFILGPHQAYLGVLIDDLVSQEHHEPYRMTTSRAQFRLHLRYDNAASRLMPIGYRLGLVSREDFEAERERELRMQLEALALKTRKVRPDRQTQEILKTYGDIPLKKPVSLAELLARPEIRFDDLRAFGYQPQVPPSCFEELERSLKYEPYLDRVDRQLEGFARMESIRLPEGFTFQAVRGLTDEVRGDLEKFGPENMGQVSRVHGISAEDVTRVLQAVKEWEASPA